MTCKTFFFVALAIVAAQCGFGGISRSGESDVSDAKNGASSADQHSGKRSNDGDLVQQGNQRGLGRKIDFADEQSVRDLVMSDAHACIQATMRWQGASTHVESTWKTHLAAWQHGVDQGWPQAQYLLGHSKALGLGADKNEWEAARLFRAAADQGYAPAQISLADCYGNTKGTIRSTMHCGLWLERASAQDCPPAWTEMGKHHHHMRHVWRERFPTENPLELYRRAAKRGHLEAWYCIADFILSSHAVTSAFEEGRPESVRTECEEAFGAFQKAAESGTAQAEYRLAKCYLDGVGVERDPAKARQHFQKAADEGSFLAKAHLSVLHASGEAGRRDEEAAIRLFKRALHDELAYDATTGCPDTFEIAAIEIRKLAEGGNVVAQNMCGIGCFHKWIYGVDQWSSDEPWEEAVDWFRRAADQGNRNAHSNLGVCYLFGIGVDIDRGQAAAKFRAAAKDHHPVALYYLAICTANGWGMKRNPAEGVKLLHQAAQHGSAIAQTALGTLYQHGNGVTQDREKAFHWLTTSAKQEYYEGAKTIPVAYVSMKDYKNAVLWLQRLGRMCMSDCYYGRGNNVGACYARNDFVTEEFDAIHRQFVEGAEAGDVEAQFAAGWSFYEESPRDAVKATRWYKEAADRGHVEAQHGLNRMIDIAERALLFAHAEIKAKKARRKKMQEIIRHVLGPRPTSPVERFRESAIWTRSQLAQSGHSDSLVRSMEVARQLEADLKVEEELAKPAPHERAIRLGAGSRAEILEETLPIVELIHGKESQEYRDVKRCADKLLGTH